MSGGITTRFFTHLKAVESISATLLGTNSNCNSRKKTFSLKNMMQTNMWIKCRLDRIQLMQHRTIEMTLRQPYSVSQIRKEKVHLQHHHAVSKHFLPISAISSVQYHYPLVETIVCITYTTIPEHKQNVSKIFFLQVLYPSYFTYIQYYIKSA